MNSIPRVNTRENSMNSIPRENLKIRYPHSMDDQRDLVKDNFQNVELMRRLTKDCLWKCFFLFYTSVWEPKPYGK